MTVLGIGAWKQRLPSAEQALAGRGEALPLRNVHHVHGRPLRGDFAGAQWLQLGMGCFWGAERAFWSLPGVLTTAVGYGGGYTPNPTYDEVCSGMTGHVELVRVVFDPETIAVSDLLRVFWESHDPTQGMRQGNDVGSQYRSAIFCMDTQHLHIATRSAADFARRLQAEAWPSMTTEIRLAGPFYFAEDVHQQYLSKHPSGYCGLRGTGVTCG
ncbi:MAG: Peptide methionine sulfoxide reductase MsrA [Alphaproteobacteria bacterium ADurb.BinA280]|jgi:peptide-methionine (S)-S-oxide reductase|nr:MAG: Peptide methionine sulfoxide reductase MsrA [Alphaproteobacteria bacterium ADurb.BinA280]